MADTAGSLALVLHAHLPYVRHPEWPYFFEEDWYFEACCETYIPLINVMGGLTSDGVDWRLTMSLTPTLLSMCRDGLLQSRVHRYAAERRELAEREIHRLRNEPDMQALAVMYRDHYDVCLAVLERCGGDLSREFDPFERAGNLEIVTCGATHGFFPLMGLHPQAVRAQVQVAVQLHESVFGRRPRGIWLPECGYAPGHEQILYEAGLRYFFVEAHGVLFGSPRPRFGTFAPVVCAGAPVAAFGRDVESSKQVWSSKEGYPGDFEYREFYRDVGWDLDHDYVRPYLHGMGERRNLGIKYHRITGDVPLGEKELYHPAAARERAAAHAGDFLDKRRQQMEHVGRQLGCHPLVVAPYDAELYGHWWWEGPMFLDFVFRKVHFDNVGVAVTTPSDYLAARPTLQKVEPNASSWGYLGYSEFWLNDTNAWLYRHLHQATGWMIDLAQRFALPTEVERRALNQCARELLLAQASDWAFILKTGTTVEYARLRTSHHLYRFNRLRDGLLAGQVDAQYLGEVEGKDNLFPEIDYRVYAGEAGTGA